MAKKKRYHQSMKDRRDERRGMEDRLGQEFYAGLKLRTKTETRDYHMLSEDRSAIANMPQEVIMKQYPRTQYAAYEHLNDDIRGIDYQMKQDSKKQKRGEYPEKY